MKPPFKRKPYSPTNSWTALHLLYWQLFKEFITFVRKPRTIRIGKTKIIITLLWVFLLWPSPDTSRVYADDMGMSAVKPVLKHVPVVSPVEPLERLKPVVVVKKTAPAPKRATGGSCASWMASAGIPSTYATNRLILKESGCNPYAQNPTSTAYGIMQFLNSTWGLVGCVKTSDPVQQLVCGDRYVKRVYGSWEAALAFHNRNNWY